MVFRDELLAKRHQIQKLDQQLQAGKQELADLQSAIAQDSCRCCGQRALARYACQRCGRGPLCETHDGSGDRRCAACETAFAEGTRELPPGFTTCVLLWGLLFVASVLGGVAILSLILALPGFLALHQIARSDNARWTKRRRKAFLLEHKAELGRVSAHDETAQVA